MLPPIFSIVTPTFNSSNYIHRVFESICHQTFRRLEWVVIDDASSDNTLEILRGYQKSAWFPVKIIEKPENRGLLDSYNVGVAAAEGEFFVGVGHDDAFDKGSLQFFWDAWNAIPDENRDRFCAITVQCRSEEGSVSESFPADGLESNFIEMYFRYRCRAEQWSIYRTNVLKQFPFPNQYRLGEGVFVWFPMAERYQSLYFNRPLRTYYRDNPSSLTNSRNARTYAKEMCAVSLLLFQYTQKYSPKDKLEIILHLARYLRFSWHSQGASLLLSLKAIALESPMLVLPALPMACAMIIHDRLRQGRSHSLPKSTRSQG